MSKTANKKATKKTYPNKFVPNDKPLRIVNGNTNLKMIDANFINHCKSLLSIKGRIIDTTNKYNDSIKVAEKRLENYLKKDITSSDTIEYLENQIDSLKEEKKESISKIKSETASVTQVDKNLYSAYYWLHNTPEKETYSNEYETLYIRAWLEWFDNWNLYAGSRTLNFIKSKFGIKLTSSSQFQKNSFQTTVHTEKQFITLVYSLMSDLLIKKGVVDKYAFQYEKATKEEIEKSGEYHEPEKVETKDSVVVPNYMELTKNQLLNHARQKRIKGYSKMSKDQLINALLTA